MTSTSAPLLTVKNLVKHYGGQPTLLDTLTKRKPVQIQALNSVSFDIRKGETLGLIGESGCGKSTLGRTILRLHEPTSGEINFQGTDITALDTTQMKVMRQHLQIVFQDPYASLNPRRTIAEIVGLSLQIHGLVKTKSEMRDKVVEIIESVGLKAAHLDRYAHQFSGGQRQRIGIARALILNPQFVVCDEPVSALDVSIQAQIIQLLNEMKKQRDLTYLFISHDISVIGYLSDRVAVMYLGEIVEMGDTESVLSNPRHPYTKSLLSAVPDIDNPERKQRIRLSGDLPSPLNPPSGCKFHTRCPFAMPVCSKIAPQSVNVAPNHQTACHLEDKNLVSAA